MKLVSLDSLLAKHRAEMDKRIANAKPHKCVKEVCGSFGPVGEPERKHTKIYWCKICLKNMTPLIKRKAK